MPTMLSVIPASLSLPAGSASTYDADGIDFDFAINTIPFLSAARESRFLERKTAPFRKQQFDMAANAGEQTFSGYWYRSQLSFHSGAGQRYLDPLSTNPYAQVDQSIWSRFYDSAGVDVWTQGKISLLPASASMTAASNTQAVSYTASGRDVAFFAGGVTPFTVFSNAGVDGNSTGAWWAGTAPTTCTTNGTLIYAASTDGVYSTPCVHDISASAWTKVWNSGSSANAIGWVKQRLVAGIGASIYELVGAGAALPAAKYTHPNASWVWTSIAETSTAIYAAGYAGASSAIYKFVLGTTDGTMPTLTSGIVAAQLPAGETVQSIYGYLGIYLCIGTSKGVRIAVANDTGDLEYGPLIVELSNPVYQFAARDRFVWFTASAAIGGGKSGTYRIDLGNQVANLRFAYASDFYEPTSTGTVRACAFIGATNRIAFSDAAKIWYAHVSDLISSGSLTTSRIRFSTLEPKLFKLARLRGPTLVGSLSVATLDQTDVETPILTVSGSNPGADDISLNTPASAQEFISLKFTLARNAVTTSTGAELYGYQLKALPASPRKRLLVLPFLCFDHEKDTDGGIWGYEGNAIDRLEQLEALEDAGNTVLLQDLRRDRTYECTIEDIRFVQTSPPSGAGKTWGGYVFVSLRTV